MRCLLRVLARLRVDMRGNRRVNLRPGRRFGQRVGLPIMMRICLMCRQMRRRVCRRVGLSNRYAGCRSGGCAVRRALYPAHNGGYDHNGIDVGDKAHQHYGVFGDPGVRRDVAVANGQNGDVAEIEKIVDGVFACAESIEGAGGGKFDGQKEIESAIGDEHEAADGREYHACADHLRVGYLTENLQGHAAEKADVEQQHFGQQAAGKKEVQRSADHQQHAKKHHCARCHTFTEAEVCSTCLDPARDPTRLAVVETPADQAALERTEAFKGLYFVLMGRLSPLDGVGPKDIGLQKLMERATDGTVQEVILATSFNAEGEATAHVISETLKSRGVHVTRLARGVPVGSELEYVDLGTIAHALVDRR